MNSNNNNNINNNNNNNNNINLSKIINGDIIDSINSLDKLKSELQLITQFNNNFNINNINRLKTIINYINIEIIESNKKYSLVLNNKKFVKSLFNSHSNSHNNSNNNNSSSECDSCNELNELVNEISNDLNVFSCGCSIISRELGSALAPLQRVLVIVDGRDQPNQSLVKEELAQLGRLVKSVLDVYSIKNLVHVGWIN